MGQARKRREAIRQAKESGTPKDPSWKSRGVDHIPRFFRFKHPEALTTRQMGEIIRQDLTKLRGEEVEMTQRVEFVNPEREIK